MSNKTFQLSIVFQVEPADYSVGIMSEGFSAFEKTGESWVNLEASSPQPVYQWFNNETGQVCERPVNGLLIERLLISFMNDYYGTLMQGEIL